MGTESRECSGESVWWTSDHRRGGGDGGEGGGGGSVGGVGGGEG